MDFIVQPWHWAFSGCMIVVVMFLLIMTGRRFGVSSSFRAVCTIAGGGKWSEYFNYDWKSHTWLLLFVIGSVIGGYLASHWLDSAESIALSSETVADLSELGIAPPVDTSHASSLMPQDLFTIETLLSFKGVLLFVVGGFLIGFGTRWAGGCTSGHAISGLSNLQVPSLVAVVGFFIGGLLMTHLLFPLIFAS